MPAFTKGKWIDCGDYTIGVEDENGYIKYYICECESVDFHITDEEVRANARLIAAAPDMYEATVSLWHILKFLLAIVPDELKKDLPERITNVENLLKRIHGEENN